MPGDPAPIDSVTSVLQQSALQRELCLPSTALAAAVSWLPSGGSGTGVDIGLDRFANVVLDDVTRMIGDLTAADPFIL